jgi:hypothetical protein
MFAEAVVDRVRACGRWRPSGSGKHAWTSTVALCKDVLWVAGRACACAAVLTMGNVVHGAGPGAL